MSESSSSTENSPEAKIKKKRGVRNSDRCKHEIIKKAKIQGLAHENFVGNTIPTRKTRDSCL